MEYLTSFSKIKLLPFHDCDFCRHAKATNRPVVEMLACGQETPTFWCRSVRDQEGTLQVKPSELTFGEIEGGVCRNTSVQ